MKGTINKLIGLLLCVCMLLAVVAGCGTGASTDTAGGASNTLRTVLNRGYLIVGTGSNNVPWHFKDDQGVYQGFDVEMARILANALFKDPSKVEFVEQASDARIPNLIGNKVDICIQFMTISAERAQQIAFSIPYYTEGSALMLSASGKHKTYDDLVKADAAGETVKIGVLQNAFANDIVAGYIKGAVPEQFEEQAMVIQALRSNVVDAAAIDLSNLKYEVAQHPELYIDSGYASYPQNYGMGMRPDDQVWINFVNAVVLDSMTGASYDTYIDAYTRWFGESDQLSEPTVGMPKQYRNNNN